MSVTRVTRGEAYRDETAWVATCMAGTVNVSNMICALGRHSDWKEPYPIRDKVVLSLLRLIADTAVLLVQARPSCLAAWIC